MATPEKSNPVASDVLHSESHSRLTPEEIAKAVRHHQREHPGTTKGGAPRQQKIPKK